MKKRAVEIFSSRTADISERVKEIWELCGVDMSKPSVRDTPLRIARVYADMFAGLAQEPPKLTCFKNEGYSQLVTVANIDFHSICEHHGLPFIGRAHIGYLPKSSIVGLSKLARVVDYFARRPQVQERLTQQVADFLWKELKPCGVIVVLEAMHQCMAIRGVQKAHHNTLTTAFKGTVDKQEFLETIKFGSRGL